MVQKWQDNYILMVNAPDITQQWTGKLFRKCYAELLNLFLNFSAIPEIKSINLQNIMDIKKEEQLSFCGLLQPHSSHVKLNQSVHIGPHPITHKKEGIGILKTPINLSKDWLYQLENGGWFYSHIFIISSALSSFITRCQNTVFSTPQTIPHIYSQSSSVTLCCRTRSLVRHGN